MDSEKLATLRYNCLLLARPNETDRNPQDVIAAATLFYDFVISGAPAVDGPYNIKETDDEIPF